MLIEEISLGDTVTTRFVKWTMTGIAFSLIGGFFGLIVLVVFFPINSGIRDIIMMLVGGFLANIHSIVNYYFGNSLHKRHNPN